MRYEVYVRSMRVVLSHVTSLSYVLQHFVEASIFHINGMGAEKANRAKNNT